MAEKLKRWLVLGSVSTYIAGPHKITEEMPQIPSLDQLILESKEEEIVQLLTQAAADVSSGLTDPVMLAYATSMCIKSDSSRLRDQTYAALTSICLTSDGLFRLLEALRNLTRKNTKKVGMWGKGMRKALKRWYMMRITKGEEYFATILISEKASYGWSHSDVLKLIHFSAPTPELDAIIQYFAFGKSESLPKLSPGLQDLANKVDELKKCQDGSRAAALLKELKILPYAMPAKFHKNREVWAAYMHNLPLREVLNRLEFLTTIKNIDTSELHLRLEKADPEDLDAGEVAIYLAKYQTSYFNTMKRRFLKRKNDEAEMQQASGLSATKNKKKNKTKEAKPLPTIVEAVNGLYNSCLDKLPNEKRVWTFIFDLSKEKTKKCSYPRFLQVSDAAVHSMQYVQRTGQVNYFEIQSLHPSPIFTSMMSDSMLVIRSGFDFGSASTEIMDPKTDVIVFVSDTPDLDMEPLQDLMAGLRLDLRKPDLKVIIMLLTSNRSYNVDYNTLVICGWDERAPRLMNHFAKGDF